MTTAFRVGGSDAAFTKETATEPSHATDHAPPLLGHTGGEESGDEGPQDLDHVAESSKIDNANHILRTVRAMNLSRRHNANGPTAPPGLPNIDTSNTNQVVELQLKTEDDDEENDDPYHNMKVDDITCRDKIFFLADGFPSQLYRKKTASWVIASNVIGNIMLLLVVVTCISFSAETLPEFYERDLLPFTIIEAICIGFFTLELLVRAILVRDHLWFWKSIQNWIDLISILPFYVGLFIDTRSAAGLIMFRTLRLMRVFRVLKLSKHSVGLQAVVESMLRSSEAIYLLIFLLMIATVLFSSALFYAEQTEQTFDEDRRVWLRPDGTLSPFQSIFHTMWWCIVTMTTVGYGDDVPITPLGKTVASITMLCGVFVLAFPTVILSTNFQEVHQAKLEESEQRRDGLLDMLRKDDTESDEDNANASNEDTQQRQPDGDQTPSAEPDEGGEQATSTALPSEGATKVCADGTAVAQAEREQDSSPSELASQIRKAAEAEIYLTYTYNPYQERKREGNPKHSFQRPPSPDTGVGVPVLTLTSEPPAKSSADPSSIANKASDAVAINKTVEAGITIINEEFAVFEPCLYFEANERNYLLARVESTGSMTDRQVVTLFLVLQSEECRLVVEETVAQHRPELLLTIVPRPIQRLTLSLTCNHPLLRNVHLTSTTFDRPAGTVPVTFVLPNNSVVSVFLSNLNQVNLMFDIVYEETLSIEEPLLRYAGVILNGDPFDDEDETNAFVTEHTLQRRAEAEPTQDWSPVGAFGGEPSPAFAGSGDEDAGGANAPPRDQEEQSAASGWSEGQHEEDPPNPEQASTTREENTLSQNDD